jgi:hypothetical protein
MIRRLRERCGRFSDILPFAIGIKTVDPFILKENANLSCMETAPRLGKMVHIRLSPAWRVSPGWTNVIVLL